MYLPGTYRFGIALTFLASAAGAVVVPDGTPVLSGAPAEGTPAWITNYEGVQKVAQGVEAALSSGVTIGELRALVAELEEEIEAVPADSSELYTRYKSAVAMLDDSLTIWWAITKEGLHSRAPVTHVNIEGRQELQEIFERYGFATSRLTQDHYQALWSMVLVDLSYTHAVLAGGAA